MGYYDEQAVRDRIGKKLRRRIAILVHWFVILPVLALITNAFFQMMPPGYPLLEYVIGGFGFLIVMLLPLVVHTARFLYIELLERGVRREMERRMNAAPPVKLKNADLVYDEDPFEPYIGNDGEFVVSDAPDDYEAMRPHLQDTGEFVPDDIDSIRRAKKRKR